MIHHISNLVHSIESELISCAQNLIAIESFTGNEKKIALLVKEYMQKLGYDEIIEDEMGNIIGRIGSGPKKILFDAHMDTVSAGDTGLWKHDPFSAQIVDGMLYGRGSVDMKGALACIIYLGYIAKKLKLDSDKTIYISASIMEEDYDGEALDYILKNVVGKIDSVVICEPSNMSIGIGHKGRTSIKITVPGVSAHGSSPQKGVNAVYKAVGIIQKIESLNTFLENLSEERGSIALTKMETDTMSLNSIPRACTLYLDRRLSINENYEYIQKEMSFLLEGTDAQWEILELDAVSWKDYAFKSRLIFPGWKTTDESTALKAAKAAYTQLFDAKPPTKFLSFSTNAVSSAGKHNIDTIVLGPGNVEYAHKVDEVCPVKDLIEFSKLYALLIAQY